MFTLRITISIENKLFDHIGYRATWFYTIKAPIQNAKDFK
jgi:hypothetical protein